MKSTLLAILYSFVFSVPSVVFSSERVNVVVDPWAPFGGENLHNGGISLDVITEVLTRAGYEVQAHIVPWERAVEGTKKGNYDVLGNLFYEPEMETYLSYGDPFYESEVRFVRRRGTDHVFTNLSNLRDLSIAVGSGYLYEEEFDRADYLRKTEVTSVVQGVRMVASGRVDLTLDSVDVLRFVISQEAPELSAQLEILPNPLSVQNIHMAVRNDYPRREALISDFNRVLGEMRADGSLDALLENHQYQ